MPRRRLNPSDPPSAGHLPICVSQKWGGSCRVRLLRSFDPHATSPDVEDPYYGSDGDFERVLEQVEAAVPGLLEEVRARLDG